MLNHMVAAQRHRGPDGSGRWLSLDESVGLCHTRLAILDLSPTGAQPMTDGDERATIVFNGEIYNWQELRSDLEARGCRFRGHSDTEVLLAAYLCHGHALPDVLRGMFAFAIFDHRDQSLFCVRDHVGKKPFVYAQTAAGFFFASEIPAILPAPGVDRRPDHAALAGMFMRHMRHIVDPYTAFAGIQRLRPGHALCVRDGQISRTWRWWQPQAEPSSVTTEELRDRLERSTRLRMVADVPVGALLSGGVDSTAIVGIMQRAAREPVRTYAFGFDAQDEDLRRARTAASSLGCLHKEFYFEPAHQLDVFQRLIGTLGEPIMLLPLIHAFELCKAIRQDGIRVILAGHGADELFYGYTGHFRAARVSDWLAWLDPLAAVLPDALADARMLPAAARFALSAPGLRKARLCRDGQAEAWRDLIVPAQQSRLRNVVAEELALWGSLSPARHFIDESNFCGLLVENTHSLTTSADLPAMMASVEMRAPFLDRDMLALAAAIHYRRKVPHTQDSGQLKLILKRAVADLVPNELLYAPKRGFGMSIQEDMVFRGPWREFAADLLTRADDVDGLFDPRGVARIWQRFIEGDSRNASTVARLTALQYWARARRAPTLQELPEHAASIVPARPQGVASAS